MYLDRRGMLMMPLNHLYSINTLTSIVVFSSFVRVQVQQFTKNTVKKDNNHVFSMFADVQKLDYPIKLYKLNSVR